MINRVLRNKPLNELLHEFITELNQYHANPSTQITKN